MTALDTRTPDQKSYYFTSPSRLTKILKIFFYASIAVTVLSGLSSFMEAKLVSLVAFGDPSSVNSVEFEEMAKNNDARETYVAFTQLAVYVMTVIVYLFWLARIALNLRFFGTVSSKFSPAWHIVWFIVPIANAFMSFFVLRKFWRGSVHSELAPKTGENIIVVWWVFFMVARLFDRGAARFYNHAYDSNNFPDMFSASLGLGVSQLISAASIAATIILVNRFCQRQNTTYATIKEGHPETAPIVQEN